MDEILSGFLELASKLFIVYLMIILGVIWRFSPLYDPKYGKWFTSLVMWVFFPITIISSFASIETFFGDLILKVIIIALAVHGLSFTTIYFLSRNRPPSETGSLVLCSTFPNSLLYPFPIILALLGESGLIYATIFVFVAMLLRNSFGVAIGFRFNPHANENGSSSLNRSFIFKMLRFPPFLALLAGFAIYTLFGPQMISNIPGLRNIKDISLYGALLLVGMSFRDINELHPRNFFSSEVVEVGTARFIVGPLVALGLVLLTQAPAIIAIPVIIQSMAPPAVANILYGVHFGFNEGQISTLITSLTLIALLILPIEIIVILYLFPIT